MAQLRRWNYQDDDATWDLNQRENGIFPPGLYRGFDASLAAGMTLDLIQTVTGALQTDTDGITENQYGIWYTKQGTVVYEDATVSLPIDNGDGQDRIDLIVGQHQYVYSVGGAAATYVVIKGTPATTPVAPSLTLAPQQVILGQLYVPAGTTSLLDAGVVYTKASTPNFGEDATIVHTDREQTFTAEQSISKLTSIWGSSYVDSGGNIIDLSKDSSGVSHADAKDNYDKNFHFIETPALGASVSDLSGLPTPAANEAKEYTFFNIGGELTVNTNLGIDGFFQSAKGGGSFTVHNGGSFTVVYDGNLGGVPNTSWVVVSVNEVGLDAPNRFTRIQHWNQAIAEFNPLNPTSVQLNAAGAGNTQTVNTIPAQRTIDYIQETGNEGTILLLQAIGEPFIINHLGASAPAGYKPIYTPAQETLELHNVDNVIMLVEDATSWRIVSPQEVLVDDEFVYTDLTGVNFNTTAGSIHVVKLRPNLWVLNHAITGTATATAAFVELDFSSVFMQFASVNDVAGLYTVGISTGMSVARPVSANTIRYSFSVSSGGSVVINGQMIVRTN